MDEEARRIDELIGEACGLVGRAEARDPDRALAVELEQVRSLLLALAGCTSDDDTADAACGVVAEIDVALCRVTGTADRHAA